MGIIQPRVVRNELPWVPVSFSRSTLKGLKQHGVTISSEINDTTNGTREFEVQDLGGYVLCFGQVL